MVQSPRLRNTPGGAKCFGGEGEGGRSLTTVGVCVQQQDRAAGGRVLVPAGLTRTRLPLVSRRAAPRPPAARADVVHGGVAQPDSASACHAEGCGFEPRRPRWSRVEEPVVLGGPIPGGRRFPAAPILAEQWRSR